MKRITAAAIRTTTRLALGLSLVLALLAPLGYLTMAYERQRSVIETEAEAAASALAQLISANPEFWRFEMPRLESVLSRRPLDGHREIRRIVGLDNAVLAERTDALDRPFVTRSSPLYDSGKVVARIEVSRSLRPILLRTLGLALLGLGFGAGAFILLWTFPLRALQGTLRSLQESEAKFRAIAETAADGVIVMDGEGRVAYWNHAAEQMFRHSVHEVMGEDLHRLISPPSYHEQFRRGFALFARTGQGPAIGNTLEFTARRKDGSEFPIEISTSAFEMDGSWNAVGIIRDISERKKTEQELAKLEKIASLGVLAGGIAHDFNNLLTVILGNVSLALLDADPSDKSSERLREAEAAVLRARSLTLQLLTFARGGAPVKKTSSIRKIVVESCNFAASGANVKCSFSFNEDLKPASVDAGQIGQVVHNIVINAVQAMPSGGSILVSGENVTVGPEGPLPLLPGLYVRISVQDHGTGISREILPKIFDPYFTTKKKGSGLGLATSYSIIKRHGGHIEVESEPGAGTTFRIYLPASGGEPQSVPAQPEGVPTGKGRILVMDDEDDVRRVVGEMLRKLGYEPDFAREGAEAVMLYQHSVETGLPFAAVIMDLTIPGGMGGQETIKKLIEIDPGARVIVASGYSTDPVMADFESYGFLGVLSKPFTAEMLATVLQECLE